MVHWYGKNWSETLSSKTFRNEAHEIRPVCFHTAAGEEHAEAEFAFDLAALIAATNGRTLSSAFVVETRSEQLLAGLRNRCIHFLTLNPRPQCNRNDFEGENAGAAGTKASLLSCPEQLIGSHHRLYLR